MLEPDTRLELVAVTGSTKSCLLGLFGFFVKYKCT